MAEFAEGALFTINNPVSHAVALPEKNMVVFLRNLLYITMPMNKKPVDKVEQNVRTT
jgi:hypothetical protein